jgi:hypothetical protein
VFNKPLSNIVPPQIPCRLSGYPNFAKNTNNNETFVMLIEKAYAKLHGCYESLNYGLIEKVIPELTQSAHVQVIKEDVLETENGGKLRLVLSCEDCLITCSPRYAADLMWDSLEHAFTNSKVSWTSLTSNIDIMAQCSCSWWVVVVGWKIPTRKTQSTDKA